MDDRIHSLWKHIKEGTLSHADAARRIRLLAEQCGPTADPSECRNDPANPPEVYVYDEPYLRDHTVNGEQVLAGVTLGSLAINAFFRAYPEEESVQLNQLTFAKPIAVKKDQRIEVRVAPVRKRPFFDFEIKYRCAPSEPWQLNATGSMQKTDFEDRSIGLRDLQDSFREVEDLGAVYDGNPAVRLGESFRMITRLLTGKDQVLARVEPAGISREENHEYSLHPHILNGAFLAVVPLLKSSGFTDGFLPFGIKEIKFRKHDAPQACWIRARLTRNSGEMAVFDADVITDGDRVVARLSGCSVKRLRGAGRAPERPAAGAATPPRLFPQQHLPEPSENSVAGAADIEAYLLRTLREAGIDVSNASDGDTNLMDLGVESSQLVSLAAVIGRETHIELSPTLFFEYPSIRELTEYFSREHRGSFAGLTKRAPTQSGPDAAARTQDLPPSGQRRLRDASLPVRAAGQAPAPAAGADARPLRDDIAVIGMHGVFAESTDPEQFWNNLLDKKDLIREVPPDHWDYRPWFDENPNAKDKTYCKWGSFIEGVDAFDARFFNISPREADWMDPQIRLLLQTIYATAEDAGCADQLRGGNTGVYVGVCLHDYADKIAEMNLPVDPHIETGNAHTVIANRISYYFNLSGPSMAIDTACSSSLFALHLACQALRNGECETAFVAGANLLLSSWHYRYFCSVGALSPTGRCHTFDEAADGYVPGECVASVLLKPLSRARKDGDRIHAIIKGSAALHGGYTPSLTAPSVGGEENVILKAWKDAGIDPASLSYLEAHGTGTKLGDPVEINSVIKAFRRHTGKEHFCAIGSAKSNIGHTEGAAGIAALLKVILQMKHRTIPAMPHFKKLNPYIQLDGSPLYINREHEDWNSPPGVPRRAGINSFGFSGAYAHVVLEEYAPVVAGRASRPVTRENPALILLSARNEAQLLARAGQLAAALRRQAADFPLADAAYTLQTGREAMEERLAVIAGSAEELAEKLDAFTRDRDGGEGVYRGQARQNRELVEEYAGDSAKAMLQAWLEEKKLNKLAVLWVKGVAVDWNRLYDGDVPRKTGLPAYPFARDRYWLGEHARTDGEDGMQEASSSAGGERKDSPSKDVLHAEGPEKRGPGVPAPPAAVPPCDFSDAGCKPSRISLTPLAGAPVSGEPEDRVQRPAGVPPSGAAPSAPDAGEGPQLSVAPGVSEESLQDYLATSLAETLFMKRSEIGLDDKFVEIGLDSITGVQWIQAVNNRYGTSVNATRVYRYPTLREFSGFFLNELKQRTGPRPDPQPRPAAGPEASPRTQPEPQQQTDCTDAARRLPLCSGVEEDALSGQTAVAVREIEPGIVQITMQDRVNKNTFSEQLISGLTSAFASVESDPSRKAVILTGFDTYFASGGTKEGLLAIQEGKVRFTDFTIYNLALNCRLPVIAAMQGHAIGAGWSMGMFCDFIILSRESVYTSNYMKYGFTPGAGATLVFPEKLGVSLAQEILFTGRQFTGAELEAKAFPFPVVARNEVLPHAVRLAKELSAAPRDALIALKDLMTASLRGKLASALDNELKMHERTFVNQPEVKARIQSLFSGGPDQDGEKPGVPGPPPRRSPDPEAHPSFAGDGGENRSLPGPAVPIAAAKGNAVPEHVPGEPIAVIGMSGQFPKANTPAEFWENLARGRDCISEIPASRWPLDRFYDPDPEAPGKTYCRWMGLLEDADKFDPQFFNISPKEAVWMDPQQRLFLENAWRCIEDAGINPLSLSGSRCGVYVGCGTGDYGQIMSRRGLNAQGFMGGSISILSARIAYFLNLKGPCLAIDTACSSSLVAIAEACNSLLLRTTDLALAGGVTVLAGPSMHIMTSKAGMLSPDGRCFTFDSRANGFVPGEGVGVLLLKRLSDAVRDGDRVYGVIRGWGVNQDGKTNGITAPSEDSQSLLEQEVYSRFGIDPETITLAEAHGTGTKLGDPIEVEALTRSFRLHTDKKNFCALGSVKSNIGHVLAAAGVSAVIKVLLAMQHRMLPPAVHFERLNEHIVLDDSPFYINTGLRPWNPAPGAPRRACVSSFGFSGTNGHIVFEEYISPAAAPARAGGDPPVLFVLSAKSEDRLKDYAQAMKDFIESREDVDLADLAYTLQAGREAMECRLAFPADTRADVLKNLDSFIDDDPTPEVLSSRTEKARAGRTEFASDEDAKVLVQTWIRKRKFKKLAELWVTGMSIDWKALYADAAPRRISLPAYPFARERYWVPDDGVKEQTDTVREPPGNGGAKKNRCAPAKGAPRQERQAQPACRPLPQPVSAPGAVFPGKPSDIVLNPLAEDGPGPEEQIRPPEPTPPPGARAMETQGDDPPKAVSSGEGLSEAALREELAASLAETLDMQQGSLDRNKKFIDMGLDSIIGVEWIRALNQRYGTAITATRLYDYPTIREFAGFLRNELNSPGGGCPAPGEGPQDLSLDAILAQVQNGTLDIEQADQALDQCLPQGERE